jgi:dual specificity MAP kinase phosphatase
LLDDIEVFERNHPELVAIDSCGRTTDNRLEFLNQEREEMRRLTTATKISENVYLGNSADVSRSVIECIDEDGKVSTRGFDVAIEAKDAAQVASAAALRDAETFLNGGVAASSLRNGWYSHCLTRPVSLEFPSSSPPTSRHDPEAIIAFCEWIYHIAHTPAVDHTDFDMIESDTPDSSARMILIYCLDGYTESTFLALAYIMFAEGITAHEAWMRLHLDLERSFFAFETDLKVLTYLEPHLLARSPSSPSFVGMSSPLSTPSWFTHVAFDGSFPSRILPHMYLGNLNHANNPEMLRALGITRVLSIGEQVVWDVEKELAEGMQLLYLDNVQDNGIDPLLDYIDACLEFLGRISLYYTHLTSRRWLSRWRKDARALSRRRQSFRQHLYRRSHAPHLLIRPTSLPLRSCPPSQCHHPTQPPLHVRTYEMGRTRIRTKFRAAKTRSLYG